MSFEHKFGYRREVKKIPPVLLADGHLNPEVIDNEWNHGGLNSLKFKNTKRAKEFKGHLIGCSRCKDLPAARAAMDQDDGKSHAVPVGDR